MAASPLDAFDIAAEADDLQKRDEAKADRRYEWLVKEFDHIQKNFDKIRENVFKRLETPSNPRFYFYNDPDWLEIEDAITRYPQLELRVRYFTSTSSVRPSRVNSPFTRRFAEPVEAQEGGSQACSRRNFERVPEGQCRQNAEKPLEGHVRDGHEAGTQTWAVSRILQDQSSAPLRLERARDSVDAG